MRTIVTFLVGISLAAFACGAEPSAPNPAKAPRDTYPLYGRVVSINSQTLVIKGGRGKPDRNFALSQNLAIKKGKKPATMADVVVGQWVGGLVRKTAGAPPVVESLNLSVKQKP